MTFVHAYLTCKDQAEAQIIADALLTQKLIACAKVTSPLQATYWWKGSLEKAGEVQLIIDTHESRLPKVEEVIGQHHSYETFVMTAVPMTYISKNARLWLQESLNLL